MFVFLIDRNILLAAGLQPHDLPAHLSPSPKPLSDDPALVPNVSSQPEDRDCLSAMAQSYQYDLPNGQKSLDLVLFVDIIIRFIPRSDPDPDFFAQVVWSILNDDTKTKLKNAAKEDPPDRASIGDILYTPTRHALVASPEPVPTFILDTFTSMKTPEVTEWVVYTQK